MKTQFKLYTTLFVALFVLASSCNQVLEEHPKDRLTPDYFQTAQGVTSGLTAAYSYFRFYYGTQGGMNLSVFGTDEFTHGSELNNPPLNIYTGINSSNGDVSGPWNRAYPAINTCNGVIEYAQKSTALTDAQKTLLLAEAKFLRAQWYFILLQTFGPVTLDLGSGPLKFNATPSNIASRSSVAEVYTAIIDDATEASKNLPDRPAAQGRVWKASALHLLAKAYLTRGWSAQAQANDFQNAYQVAKQLIDNKTTYGVDLLPDYADVHRQGNEYSKEVLFQVDWIDNTQYNNNVANGAQGDDGVRQNVSLFLFRCRYIDLPGMVRDVTNGRPFVRYKPTPWLLDNAFADKVNDSRYNKSFQTVWIANTAGTIPTWTQADVDAGNVSAGKIGQPKFALGDTAAFMVPKNLEGKFTPLKDKKGYRVFLPTEVNGQNKFYPTLKKFDATQGRPNNDPNITSVRPFIVYRFAETYLIAAEAAYKLGQINDAANLINVVRTRAAANVGAIAAITANTEADLTATGIDYILDERARELCGEQMRWFDLARTGKLLDRVKAFNAQAAPGIKDFHVLRPIPQPQIDGSVDPTAGDKKYPQNGGY
ncbi:RagB/SusD family nutrient uptake outer membrane protein [Chryseolinea lacunae]|uniref:RagB/SusD family nutrient uptake outer membrane protein n=1 Tax=Chryseolinea lacunae TaxID=2801331 RepID=A0ABS1KYL4_9BACT|nr:RagB/SusD family nutrient uptake outer membrane protein [Chryseolinea lacunae]MBL0744540.1 RagB/SusD family nutrient uptake outer membrane protein [Chryseolinea lacunae]